MNKIKDLDLKAASLMEPIEINKEIYDAFVLYSPTSSIKGKKEYKYKQIKSLIKRIQMKYKQFEITDNFEHLKKEKFIGIFVSDKLDYDKFFRSIRNAIAHGNIAKYKNKIYLIQFKGIRNTDLNKIFDYEISFVLVIDKMSFLKIINNQYKLLIGKK